MITLIVIYLLFILGYEHWAGTGVIGPVIYYAFQYGWVAVLCFWNYKQVRKSELLLLGAIFTGLSINELLCFNLTTFEYQEAVNGPGPVFGLTIICTLLFIINQIIRWKRKSV